MAKGNTKKQVDPAGSPHDRSGEGSETVPRHSIDPDEHTRLLPRPSTREGYLSPDDPAVSLIWKCCSNIANTSARFRHTISGVCGSCDTSPSFSRYEIAIHSSHLTLILLTGHHIPVVGSPSRLYLRQSAGHALPRLRLFRLLLCKFNLVKPPHCPSLFLFPFEGHSDHLPHNFRRPSIRHDLHPRRPTPPH